MRSPSARCLDNHADIYLVERPIQTDAAGGIVYTYPSAPSIKDVPCTIQAGSVIQIVDAQERLTEYLEYKVMFATQQPTNSQDKLVYTDKLGVTRTLFAQAQRDEAGRGAAFTVHWVERI